MFIALPKYATDFLKLLVCGLGIFLFIFLARYWVPSYNGEDYYFTVHERGSEQANNDQRITQANKILKDLDWKMLKTSKSMNLSISIIAADRRNGYVTQAVAYLLEQITNWKSIPEISICNVETYVFDELKQFINKLPIYSINIGASMSYNLSEDEGRIRKEADDYWKCLNASHNGTNAKYVLLLEDDAVPVPYLGVLLSSLLSQLESSQMNVDFVKLFHPWKLRKIPCLFQIIVSSVTLAFLISLVFFRKLSIYIVLMLSVIVFFCLWRQGYKEIFADVRFHLSSSAYIIPSESCCTPAVLFRGASITSMLTYFKNQTAGRYHAKDHILDESPYTGKATDFNYVVHIGHFSSVRQKAIALESLSKISD